MSDAGDPRCVVGGFAREPLSLDHVLFRMGQAKCQKDAGACLRSEG